MTPVQDRNKGITLADLHAMSLEQAQSLPREVRNELLDDVLSSGRKLLGPQIERQVGLFSDYFEEDLNLLVKIRAVRIRCSGFIPIDPSGEVPTLEPRGQYMRCFENIALAMDKMGTSLDRVTNMMIFLKNMDYWNEMNAVYRQFFKNCPTRATVGAAALNKTYQIEIANLIAYRVV